LMHYLFPCHRPSGQNPASTQPCIVVLTLFTNLFSRADQSGRIRRCALLAAPVCPRFAWRSPQFPLENPPELEGGSSGVPHRILPHDMATDRLGRAPSLASVSCL
jgi:hypothetical protein